MKSISGLSQALAVAIGGGVGALGRYYLSWWAQASIASDFPYGILLVNNLGCLLIGILAACLLQLRGISAELLRLSLMIGVLGGFTTFSSFSLDNLKLLQQGSYMGAMLNILLSVVGGLVFTALGGALGYWGMRLLAAR